MYNTTTGQIMSISDSPIEDLLPDGFAFEVLPDILPYMVSRDFDNLPHYNGETIYYVPNAAKLKERRLEAVNSVTVTSTSGKVFDGDEVSQDRMVRAISIAAITGQTTTDWKLADNTIVEVPLDELKEVLSLAGQEMSRIWLGE